MDDDSLCAFLIAVEQYFSLTELSYPVQKAHFFSILMTKHAAIWVQL